MINFRQFAKLKNIDKMNTLLIKKEYTMKLKKCYYMTFCMHCGTQLINNYCPKCNIQF